MRARLCVLAAAVLMLGLALPAMAQMMGPSVQGGPMGMPGPGMMGPGARPGPVHSRGSGWSSHEGPLITIMLDGAQELGLTPDQERKLRDLRTEFAKESVRRTADIRVAEIELNSLLEQDKWDLAMIEPKVCAPPWRCSGTARSTNCRMDCCWPTAITCPAGTRTPAD